MRRPVEMYIVVLAILLEGHRIGTELSLQHLHTRLSNEHLIVCVN